MTTLAEYRADPIAFIETELYDPETKRPFQLLPAEQAFLEHAFRTDERGKLIYPEQLYSCPKKSGKTTFAAIHALTTILLFGGHYPEAAVLANDLDQAVGRVFTMVRRIVESSPLLAANARITADKIVLPAMNATIAALGADYAGAAGGAASVACFDELWAYTSEKARRLWDEMVPPPTKQVACRLTTTYAGFTGESSLLEELYQRGMELPEVGKDLRAGSGMLMFWSHSPVAHWQDEKWLSEMRRSLRANQYLRMVENQWVSTEASFIAMQHWDACVDPNVTPIVSDKSLKIYVGVDASVKRDSTAIAACCWDSNAQKVRLVRHRIFQPSPDQPLDFEATIEATLLDLKQRFDLQLVWFDPYQMQASAQRLARQGVKLEEFPQSVPNLTASSQNLFELIQGRNLITYPDAELRLAISRAVAIETARGWRIAKEKQAHKIDVVVALAMAALATVQQGTSTYDIGKLADGLDNLIWGVSPVRSPVPPQPDREAARQAALEKLEAENARLREADNARFMRYCASGGRVTW